MSVYNRASIAYLILLVGLLAISFGHLEPWQVDTKNAAVLVALFVFVGGKR